MAALESRLKKAESTMGSIAFDQNTYKEAYKKYYRGEDNGEAIASLPPLPLDSPFKQTEMIVFSLYELEKEARLKNETFRALLGKDGRYVDETLATEQQNRKAV